MRVKLSAVKCALCGSGRKAPRQKTEKVSHAKPLSRYGSFPGASGLLAGFPCDLHQHWREAIAEVLPANYEATLGERQYLIEHEPEARKLGGPDLAVTQGEANASGESTSVAATAALEPVTIPLTILEGPREAYIEILYQPDRSLVTALELLSPTNKEQPGRSEYLAKRRALLYQKVHLVELDLLRGGSRLPLQEPLPPADCYYLVSRATSGRTVRSTSGPCGSRCRGCRCGSRAGPRRADRSRGGL